MPPQAPLGGNGVRFISQKNDGIVDRQRKLRKDAVGFVSHASGTECLNLLLVRGTSSYRSLWQSRLSVFRSAI
jgi:hypothetical protein